MGAAAGRSRAAAYRLQPVSLSEPRQSVRRLLHRKLQNEHQTVAADPPSKEHLKAQPRYSWRSLETRPKSSSRLVLVRRLFQPQLPRTTRPRSSSRPGTRGSKLMVSSTPLIRIWATITATRIPRDLPIRPI